MQQIFQIYYRQLGNIYALKCGYGFFIHVSWNVKQMNNCEESWRRRFLIGGRYQISTLRNKGHGEWHGHFRHNERSKPGIISKRLELRGGGGVDITCSVSS